MLIWKAFSDVHQWQKYQYLMRTLERIGLGNWPWVPHPSTMWYSSTVTYPRLSHRISVLLRPWKKKRDFSTAYYKPGNWNSHCSKTWLIEWTFCQSLLVIILFIQTVTRKNTLISCLRIPWRIETISVNHVVLNF